MGYSIVIRNLAQGSAPVVGADYSDFDLIVLCAEEYQPRSSELGVSVVHAGFDDSPKLTIDELRMAWRAGLQVSKSLREGMRVLTTCRQGRNRSGLVNAFALMNLGYSDEHVIDLIRRARSNALTNPHFIALIRARGRASRQEIVSHAS